MYSHANVHVQFIYEHLIIKKYNKLHYVFKKYYNLLLREEYFSTV